MISYHTCPLSDEKDADIGGLNTYVLQLSKQLAKRGHKIDIYTRCVDKNRCKVVKVQKNLRVIHLPSGPKKKLPKKELIKYLPEFTSQIQRHVRGQNLTYDLVSCHYFLSGLAGLQAKTLFNVPLFVTFHTLALMKNLVARDESEQEDLFRIEAEVTLTQKADKVLATSDADAEYIKTLYDCPKEKIFVLSPGIDHKIFKPIDKDEAKKQIGANLIHKLILSVGRIQPLKGIDVLLYSLKILKNQNPDLKTCLWIVGEEKAEEGRPDEVAKLKQITKLLSISEDVNFVKKQKHNRLPLFYNAAEVVIMPSQYESFGITALEAMACGVPVITTDTTGISDIYDRKHRLLITSAGNPNLLAEKINSLLSHNTDYQALNIEVLENVKDLSWENAAKKFEGILLF